MTKDLLRCQVAARNVALIYNWWSLFVRCAEPERPREAVTSRPLLLCAVGRVIESGRQLTLRLTSTHAHAAHAQSLLTDLSLFLSGLKNTAEQLSPGQCWERIWARILTPLLTPGGLARSQRVKRRPRQKKQQTQIAGAPKKTTAMAECVRAFYRRF